MHKGIILLVETDDKEEALSLVNEFMPQYEGNVWDWWAVGGRWNNMLAPKDLKNQFIIKVDNEILIKEEGKNYITQDMIDAKQNELQAAWKDLGLKGLNPYTNHYDLPDEGNVYDVMPLKDCIDHVKEYCGDLKKELQENYDKLVEAHNNPEGNGTMAGYYAGKYKDACYGNFCFESNVYNISTQEAEEVPEAIENFYAVMIDIHN